MDDLRKQLEAEGRKLLEQDIKGMSPGEKYSWTKEAERLVVRMRICEFLGSQIVNSQ